MTSADITKLPVQNLKRADQNASLDKKKNQLDNSFMAEFQNVVQGIEQESYKRLDPSNGISSLKPVMSSIRSISNQKVTIELKPAVEKSRPDLSETASSKNADVKKDVKVSDDKVKRETPSSKISVSDQTKEAVRDTIKKDLGVTDQELDGALEKLGLKIEDLMDPANLLLLAAELVGNGEASSLLLQDGIPELLSDVKDVFNAGALEEINFILDDEDVIYTSDHEMVSETAEDGAEMAVPETESEEDVIYTSDFEKQVSDQAETNLSQDQDVSDKTDVAEKDGKIEVIDKRTEKPVEDVSVEKEDNEEAEDIPEIITGEKSGNASDNEKKGFNDDSSRFTKTPETAKHADPVNVNQNNVQNVTSFQATYTETTSTVTYSQLSYRTIDTENVINQIVQNARVTLTDTENTMEMILNPHELGRIFMEVSERDGAFRARILTENENVKAALENQMQILQQSFTEKGFKIDAVEISVGAHQFRDNEESTAAGFDMGQNGGENRGSEAEAENSRPTTRRIDLNNLNNLRGLMTEEEILTARIMKEQGNRLDYTV